jgi:hypothetical protein
VNKQLSLPLDIPTQRVEATGTLEYTDDELIAWEVVDFVTWPYLIARARSMKEGRINFDAVKRAILEKFGDDAYRADKGISALNIRLQKKLCAAKLEYSLGLGDDSYGDLMHHIVGMGRKFYEECVATPMLIVDLAHSGDFYESFSYVTPWKEAVEEQTDDSRILSRAKRVVDALNEPKTKKSLDRDFVKKHAENFITQQIENAVSDVVVNRLEIIRRAKNLKLANANDYYLVENFFNDIVNWKGPMKEKSEWVSERS